MYIIKIPTTKGKHLLVTSQARSRGKKEIEAREKNAEPDKNKVEVNPPPPQIHYSIKYPWESRSKGPYV